MIWNEFQGGKGKKRQKVNGGKFGLSQMGCPKRWGDPFPV
jgi:hypothetical protein